MWLSACLNILNAFASSSSENLWIVFAPKVLSWKILALLIVIYLLACSGISAKGNRYTTVASSKSVSKISVFFAKL